MDLLDAHSRIKTKDDLARFIEALRADLKANPDSWENVDLDSFLDAMQ